MLVLSRAKSEIVVIETASGELIEVMVVELQGDKVRLGFAAERSVKINRKEVVLGERTGRSPKAIRHQLREHRCLRHQPTIGAKARVQPG
jgi:carbon storage regulator